MTDGAVFRVLSAMADEAIIPSVTRMTLTYGQFLLLFLVVPIAALALLVLRDRRDRQRKQSRGQQTQTQNTTDEAQWKQAQEAWGWAPSPWVVLGSLILVAVVYTAPWDNHLIAEGVWSYDPSRISGVTFGWIPLEELLFFPLQTLLIGLWVIWLLPRLMVRRRLATIDIESSARTMEADTLSSTEDHNRGRGNGAAIMCWLAVAVGCVAWLVALILLSRSWQPGTYLGWELVWALPPLILQVGLGGDILWHRRRLLLAAFIPVVIYLSAADAFAISEGIWTIAPQRSLGFLLGGVLPLEEVIFFLVTSSLVVGGLILGTAPEARKRFRRGIRGYVRRHAG
jgi:lycopene cyclase domain-containing protein